MVTKPDMENIEYHNYDDYAQLNFDATERSYIVGTNARAADSASWPTTVKARDILLYATENCYIRFNASNRVQHLLLANTYYRFRRFTTVIYYVRESIDGILYVWFEG